MERNYGKALCRVPKRLSASMAVEASYVMAMVIMALAVLIRTAYSQYRWTTATMKLHDTVQKQRFREEDQEYAGSFGQVKKDSDKVEGYVKMNEREKEIITRIYEPEEALRMLTIFGREGGQQE